MIANILLLLGSDFDTAEEVVVVPCEDYIMVTVKRAYSRLSLSTY